MNVDDKLVEFQTAIKGLRIEIEAWRRHTSTTGDFIVWELDALTKEVNALTESLK